MTLVHTRDSRKSNSKQWVSKMNPAEIQIAVQLFEILEPQVQSAIAALIHKAHKKQLTAQDYLDQAAVLVNKSVATSAPVKPV